MSELLLELPLSGFKKAPKFFLMLLLISMLASYSMIAALSAREVDLPVKISRRGSRSWRLLNFGGSLGLASLVIEARALAFSMYMKGMRRLTCPYS